jgi:hypothetical protein
MATRTDECGIDDLLNDLQAGKWRVPKFQREFVWAIQDIINLINSVFEARPVGMVTLWKLEGVEDFETERISLEDTNSAGRVYFGDERDPSDHCAILDGRQRCTSLAMVFGGLEQKNKQRKFAGRFFLSLHLDDELHPVTFFKHTEIQRMGINTFDSALGAGYVQLTRDEDHNSVRAVFLDVFKKIDNKGIYPADEMISNDELTRRESYLNQKYSHFEDTKVAIYTVPASESLQDICEIFETLNTTGTKVSTVDLVHSFLYSDTHIPGTAGSGRNLRAWIDDLGLMAGAHGWSDSKVRPELVVQFVAVVYITLNLHNIDLAAPRSVGGNKTSVIENVKNGSLLALPSTFWEDMMSPHNTERLRQYINEFQHLVAGGLFPHKRCPYPISAGLFIGLRYLLGEHGSKVDWTKGQLNSLFKSFYWRNVLSTRYDQGFLTQMTSDLKSLLNVLDQGALKSEQEWVGFADGQLDSLFNKKPVLNTAQLSKLAIDGTVAGALKSGMVLRLFARPKVDLLRTGESVEFDADTDVQVHHIFPKKWIRDNTSGQLKIYLEEAHNIGRKPENSAANLMLLNAKSNEDWSSKAPKTALEQGGIEYKDHQQLLQDHLIDEQCFDYLTRSYPPDNRHVEEFWEHRALLIAEDLTHQTRLQAPG